MKAKFNLNESFKKSIRTNVLFSVEEINDYLKCHLIVDDILFFDTFISIRIGSTGRGFVTLVELECLSNAITKKLPVRFSCSFRSVDFDRQVCNLSIEL